MTALEAASLYVGLNLVILLILGGNVIRYRVSTKTSLGMGTDPALERACRAHANGAEWTPGALIAIVLMAMLGAPVMAIHAIGASSSRENCGICCCCSSRSCAQSIGVGLLVWRRRSA